MSAVPVEIAQRSGRRERAGLFDSGHSRMGSVLRERGRRQAAAPPRRSISEGAATWTMPLRSRWPSSGDLPQSRALAEDLARQFPEDTSVQFMYLPTLRALFALNTHDAAAAIQALQTASRYDLALGGVGFIGRFGGLYPIYVRGLGVPRGTSTRRSRRRVPADSRSSKHRARRSHGRHGAPAAGESARALGRNREGEKRLQRSLCAVERRRSQDPDGQRSTSGIRKTTVSPVADFQSSGDHTSIRAQGLLELARFHTVNRDVTVT